MPINYPETLRKAGLIKELPTRLILPLGEGLNIVPFEAQQKIEFTVTPVAKGTGTYFGFFSQLKKWGFDAYKISEGIHVSPVYEEYYRVTMAQKERLSEEIKRALASIETAIKDLDLIKHDLRKYKEFMDYYAMIEEGKKLIKKGRKEEGEKLIKQGDQTLRSIFIDQVDVHTGETIALKLIAGRWPTIIADFMRLTDEDVDPEKIKEKYKISEAEAVVLATKNKLYLEWRDRLFKPTVEERYKSLMSMAQARKKSVMEYKEMAKPLIARYRVITSEVPIEKIRKVTVFKATTHAISYDEAIYWAWKPFAPTEKYKLTAEAISQVDIRNPLGRDKIGFRKWEIDFIIKKLKEREKTKGLDYYEELILKDGLIETLPMEPSIDNVVRRFVPDIERAYGIKITPLDLFEARNKLIEKFKASSFGVKPLWDYSPYFIFLHIPIGRVVVKMPTGYAEESIESDQIIAATETQNIILLRYLELIAMDKELDNYIKQMLGERGIKGEEIEELVEKSVFRVEEAEEEKEVEDISKPKYTIVQLIRKPFYDLLRYFNIEMAAFNIGPYEFNLNHRISKQYQVEVGRVCKMIVDYFKMKFDVPGYK